MTAPADMSVKVQRRQAMRCDEFAALAPYAPVTTEHLSQLQTFLTQQHGNVGTRTQVSKVARHELEICRRGDLDIPRRCHIIIYEVKQSVKANAGTAA